MATMQHPTQVETGKSNKKRYGLLPNQQVQLVDAANALLQRGGLNDDLEDEEAEAQVVSALGEDD